MNHGFSCFFHVFFQFPIRKRGGFLCFPMLSSRTPPSTLGPQGGWARCFGVCRPSHCHGHPHQGGGKQRVFGGCDIHDINDMEVSINGGSPEWTVYKGKSENQMDDLGVAVLVETPIFIYKTKLQQHEVKWKKYKRIGERTNNDVDKCLNIRDVGLLWSFQIDLGASLHFALLIVVFNIGAWSVREIPTRSSRFAPTFREVFAM